MRTQSRLLVRPATDRDRSQLANLIHFETHVHRHLDWKPPLDWMGQTPYLVAERDGNLVGALACPPDPPDVAWIRMFAVSTTWAAEEAWKALWPVAQSELHERRIISIGAIPLQKWFRTLLEDSHFQHIHNVVLMLWQPGGRMPEPKDLPVNIRPMNYDDLLEVEKLDSSAFSSIWRNSVDSLTLAFQQAAVATIAEEDGQMIGYQISTSNLMGGHLARLAVLPSYQGQGIGYALVHDVLSQFERRGSTRVTVNTQQENTGSLALYQKAGFRKTGELYPVYLFRPAKRIG